jgi:tripartite-type tricarboxylate transporter receptor subunit TctC
MKLPRRQFLHVAASAAALPVVSRIARAQTYPSRPITMIVPYPAGGPTDTIARLLGERMRASLGQPVVIENVAGAGGNIGVGRVARAAGDGYTVGIGHWGSHVVNGAIYTLPYDLLTDLEPVALISDGPQLIVAARSVPAKDIKELIAWLKANPGKAMVGTTGVGGASHLAGILFQNTTGTIIQIVPYRGAAPRMQDMLSGQIHLAFDQAASSLPQVRAGASNKRQRRSAPFKRPRSRSGGRSSRRRTSKRNELIWPAPFVLQSKGQHASVRHETAALRDFDLAHVRFGSMLLKKSLMISVSASI